MKRTIAQLFRFGCVGVLAALVNFLVVVFLVHTFGWHPLVANVVAFLIAFNVSFHGHRGWTFAHSLSHRMTLPKFFSVAVFSFLLSEGLYALFLQHWNYQIALILVLLIVPPITFCLSKCWAFRS